MKEYTIRMQIPEETEQRLHQLAALRNRALPELKEVDAACILESIAIDGLLPELERHIAFWQKLYQNEVERREGATPSGAGAPPTPEGQATPSGADAPPSPREKAFGESDEGRKGRGAVL